MTTELNITKALDFSIQQIFSESYWEDYFYFKEKFGSNPTSSQIAILKQEAKNALLHGNSNKPIIEEGGYAKLTDTLAEEALKRYEVVSYYPNDETGFSATLLRDNLDPLNPTYTLSFRSTEYSQEADFFRDAMGADKEILKTGFAYGQISSMEKFYAELKTNVLPANTQINISGYSLGGHLAYAFYTLHPNDVLKAYTENAAGIGTIGPIGHTEKTQSNYNTQLTAANLRFTNIKDDFLNTLFGNLRDSNNNLITTTINSNNYLSLISGLNIDAQDDNKIVFTGSSSIQVLGNAVAAFINSRREASSANNFSYLTLFEEAIKKAVLHPNNYPTGQGNGLTIYSDERYQIAINLTQKEFNSKTLPISPLISGTLLSQIRGRDGGSVEEDLFPSGPNGKFTTISGRATYSSRTVFNDPNFVSKSNLHSAYYDVFIEDQPELVGDGGHQPVLYEETKNFKGQYGNTHSITALIDSMRAMKTIMTLDSSITVAKAESLLSASSNRYSPHWVEMNEDNATESNSISNFINSLYRIIKNPLATNTTFNTTYNSLGQVEQRDQLHIKENEILKHVAENSLNINIKSFYDSSLDPALHKYISTNPLVSVTELKAKFKQNDAEGMAYRYALREMNNYVVLGANYSALNTNGILNVGYHSDAWYDTRAEMLMQNLNNNILNSGVYSILGTTNQNGDPLKYAVTDNISNVKRDYERLMPRNGGYGYVKDQEFLTFGTDIPVILNPANVISANQYNSSVNDDKIFLSNGLNYLEILNGKDTVETGKDFNILYIKDVNYLNLNLYGNNLIYSKPGIVSGEISYNNLKLQVGAKQTDGSYLDANYSNIKYKFTNYINIFSGLSVGDSLQGQQVFQIEFTNTDNTVNKTAISGFNNTFNFLGINLPVDYATQSTSTIVTDSTANAGTVNFYASNVLETLYPPPLPVDAPPGSKSYVSIPFVPDVTVKIGSNIYFYKESLGGSYVANIDNVVNPQLYLSNRTYDEYNDPHRFNYYKPGDKIIIAKNIDFKGLIMARNGDDLVINVLPHLQSAGTPEEQTRYKNYFKFDHTSSTDIFYRTNGSGTVGAQMPISEIAKYLVLTGTTANDDLVSSVQYKIYGGVGGNDKLTSGSLDTTFLNYGNNSSSSDFANNGNDLMISGSGSNRFVFMDSYHQHDIIENFKITDKIILGRNDSIVELNVDYSQGLNFSKIDNDLVIQLNPESVNGSTIRVKNYYQIFGNNPTVSGLYVEDIYGNSVPISIGGFEEKRLSTIKVDKDSPSQIVVESSSLTKTIELGTYNSELVIEKEGTTVLSTGGAHKQVITYDLASNLAQRGSSVQNVEMSVIKLDISTNSIHEMEINNFNSEVNQIEFVNSDIEDFFITRDNDNLVINKLSSSNFISKVVITDFFVNNFDISNLAGLTNIYIYDTVIGESLTVEDLQDILAPEEFNSSTNNAVIDASNISKNSIINSVGNEATITGGIFNDDITAGSEGDVFVMSKGVDTYHLTSTSGIDELMFDKTKLSNGTKIIVQFDSSVALEDISFYYDQYAGFFTIKVNDDAGLVITDIDFNKAYSIEQFMQVKLSNGDNVFEENYTIENGGPFHYDGLPNNILLGTSTGNTLNAITSKNNLIFGSDGNDTLTGNNNVIATGNTDYKANLLVGGLGNDIITTGSYDVVIARQGDGQDAVNYTTNHDDFLLGLIRNAGTTEFGIKTVGNNLEIYYGNDTTDKVTINSYWTKTHEDMTLVLTDRDYLNNTELRGYSISEIMSEMGLTKLNSASSINYVDYSDLEDILLVEESQLLVGGELGNYYAELGNFTGLSLSSAINTLNEFDQKVLLGKSGYGDISDYRKL